jgi:cytochrome c oxidase subunit 2
MNRTNALARLAVAAIVLFASACAGGESDLSEQAQRGQEISRGRGCAGCHGVDGQGGVGPTWIDLAGSDVELTDGTSVVADDPYLLRSILEPGAEEVAGYTIKMPSENDLTEAEAADVVAYIKELTSEPAE